LKGPPQRRDVAISSVVSVSMSSFYHLENLADGNSGTFVSESKSAELWMILEGLHTNWMVGNKSGNCNLVLFDKSGPRFRFFSSLFVYEAY